MDEERDFYEEPEPEVKEVIGYCFYCKNEIFSGDSVVRCDGNCYHKDCFLLENSNLEPGIND